MMINFVSPFPLFLLISLTCIRSKIQQSYRCPPIMLTSVICVLLVIINSRFPSFYFKFNDSYWSEVDISLPWSREYSKKCTVNYTRCLLASRYLSMFSYLTCWWSYTLKDFIILTHPDIPTLYSIMQISSKIFLISENSRKKISNHWHTLMLSHQLSFSLSVTVLQCSDTFLKPQVLITYVIQ